MAMDGIIPYVLGGGGGGGGGQSASEVAALIAGTEYSSTASQAYSKGDYFIFNGSLMVATANIASGGTITVGTNCEAVTVGEELAEVKGSLNTKAIKAAAAVQVPAQGANSGWVTLNGLTSNHELINWNFSTLGENQKFLTIQCETDTNRFRISTLANYPPANETCQPLFISPM